VPSESAGHDSDGSISDVPFEKGAKHLSVDDGVSTWAGPEHDDDVERDDTAGVLPESERRSPASYKQIMQSFGDDDYDPRMPQYVRPARWEVVISEELKGLREQVARIVPMLEAREAAGHSEALLAGYRQFLAESQLRIPDLEWVLAHGEMGKWSSKDSTSVSVARGLHRFALHRFPLKHEAYFASVAKMETL